MVGSTHIFSFISVDVCLFRVEFGGLFVLLQNGENQIKNYMLIGI